MRNTFPFLAAVATAGVLVCSCTNVENKFSRGMTNVMEPVRLGEMQRSVEQSALFDGTPNGYGSGFIRGLNRTLARTGIGVYEMVTAPFPPYDPVFTSYLSPNPVFPDSYKPGIKESSEFATDAYLGFSGVDIAPMMPGSRFFIFDTP